MLMTDMPSKAEIEERRRKRKDETIRAAESAIARIQEAGTDGIRGIALFRNALDIEMRVGEHSGRIPMGALPEGGIMLVTPKGDIATITCPPPKGEPPHPDCKWVRRPVSHAVAQGIIERLVDTLGNVASGCKSDDDIPETEVRSSTFHGFAMALLIEFDGDDGATCYRISEHGFVFSEFTNDIRQVFDAVAVPDCLGRNNLAHLESLSFTASPHAAFGYASISFVRESDGAGAHLRYETIRQIFYDKPAVDVHLAEEDWQSFLDAVHNADLPSWGASYDDKRLRHDSAWDTTSELDVSFDDGWSLRIHGWKLFDPRFVSIVRETYRHGRQTRDEEKALSFWETKEAGVQTALEDVRRSEKGRRTHLWLSAQERGADAVETWRGLAGIVRMRAMQEGLFLEGITIEKEPWNHEEDLILSERGRTPRMGLRPHGTRSQDGDEASEAPLPGEPEPNEVETPYAYDEQDEGFVSDCDSNDGDGTDGREGRDNADDFVYDDMPAFPKAASAGDENEATDGLETTDKPEQADEQEQAGEPRTADETKMTAPKKTVPANRASDVTDWDDNPLIKAIARGYVTMGPIRRRIRTARANWRHMAEAVSDARSDWTSGYVATCVVRPVRPFPENREEPGVRIKSVSIEVAVGRDSSLSVTHHAQLSRRSKENETSRIMTFLAGMDGVRWNDPADAVRWGCQLDKFDDSLKQVAHYPAGKACRVTVIWEDESVSFVSMSDGILPSVLEACGKMASEMVHWTER